eukprot:923485-Rhodomonas_salina.4
MEASGSPDVMLQLRVHTSPAAASLPSPLADAGGLPGYPWILDAPRLIFTSPDTRTCTSRVDRRQFG